MNRNELRIIIMTILYQISLYDNNKINYDVKDIIAENLKTDNKFVNNIVMGVIDNKNYIDEVINKYLKDWTINRLGLTDQAILRMGTFELLYTDTPEVVVIDEAIELAKKYSDDKVKNMINGVLDKIYHEKCLK